MILRISEKVNVNGWCRQITVDFDKKTIRAEPFQFHSADIGGLTHKQYIQVIDYFKSQGFAEV